MPEILNSGHESPRSGRFPPYSRTSFPWSRARNETKTRPASRLNRRRQTRAARSFPEKSPSGNSGRHQQDPDGGRACS